MSIEELSEFSRMANALSTLAGTGNPAEAEIVLRDEYGDREKSVFYTLIELRLRHSTWSTDNHYFVLVNIVSTEPDQFSARYVGCLERTEAIRSGLAWIDEHEERTRTKESDPERPLVDQPDDIPF